MKSRAPSSNLNLVFFLTLFVICGKARNTARLQHNFMLNTVQIMLLRLGGRHGRDQMF